MPWFRWWWVLLGRGESQRRRGKGACGGKSKKQKRGGKGEERVWDHHTSFFGSFVFCFVVLIAVSQFERTSKDRINIWFSYVCSKSHVLAMNQGVKLDEKEIRSRKDTPNTRQTLSSSLPLITTLYEIDIYPYYQSVNNKKQQSTMILYRIRA